MYVSWFSSLLRVRGFLMKSIRLICVALVASVVMIVPSTADSFKPVQSEATFKKLLVGKRWINKQNGTTATVHRNHTITGRISGKRFTGKWSWNGKYMCRTYQIAGKRVGKGCVVIKHAPGRYIAIWNKGRGKKVIYHRR